ncbi:hypothetical protein I7I49_06790 [Sinorhizobium meliloti]|uniref:hypothetical protein n=1 Tax=Rhizobium meliloti TaxID=382 RepID=UPI00237FA414|nr:hypothetical protein [Sinorhizobium meliloti]MDE3809986.1 hypothetical protein [Sinorhizobium meliloti]MDW9644441.1 hypothetical protein [Sinorhizobium meliloti]
MPLPLKDYVRQVLLENGRAGKIHNAVRAAWSKAISTYPERAGWQRKSTFRGIVWEAAVRELEAASLGDAGFRTVFHRDTASFILDDAVLFRFKHADVSLATANYPTPEASAFDDHEADLYGFRGLQRVELCYVLDEFEMSIVWIGIAARQQGEHLWSIELNNAGVVTPEAALPFEEEVDVAKLARLKAQPDHDEKKKKE